MSAAIVSDVALSMGPRNKRRLATGGIVLIALAAIVAAAWVLSAPSGSNVSGSAGSSQAVASTHPLSFGSSERTVRRIAGQPTTARGNCWFYKPKAGMVGSIPMGQPGSNAFKTADSLKLCFFGGLSSASEHVRSEGGVWQWIAILPTYITR
jgi:hypothetical protein